MTTHVPRQDGGSTIRVACIQMEPRVAENAANLALAVDLAAKAAEQGARLIVLPELCISGYVFRTKAEARAGAEPLHGGPSLHAFEQLCRARGVFVAFGFAEREGEALYNSAALVGPDGLVGTYRKLHLWGEENLFFEPGDRGLPVFQTAIGRIGMAICYDVWFPETFRLMALQGAEIICVPTNWVPMPGQPADHLAMANMLTMAGAHTNSVFVACADRIGTERGQPFEGQSLIVGCNGWPVAGPASRDRQEIVSADLDLLAARRERAWNAFNQPLRDRRIDVYSELLGADVRRGWY